MTTTATIQDSNSYYSTSVFFTESGQNANYCPDVSKSHSAPNLYYMEFSIINGGFLNQNYSSSVNLMV